MEVFTFECSNGPVCYLVGSFRVCLSAKIFSNSDSLRVAKRDDGRACFLFLFLFVLFGVVKKSISKVLPHQLAHNFPCGVNCHRSLNQLKSQSKKTRRKFFFSRDLFADVISVHNRNMKHDHTR